MGSNNSYYWKPNYYETFRIKRDATNWARTTKNEIVRGVYISRSHSEKTTIAKALERYHNEITPIKKPSSQKPEIRRGNTLRKHLGKYSLASLAAEHIANYRDMRLSKGLSASSLRLEFALLSHLYTIAIKKWGMGIIVNLVSNVRRPKPAKGRDRRLVSDEEQRLMEACEAHSNPMLAWIAQLDMRLADGKSATSVRLELTLLIHLYTTAIKEWG